MALPSPVLHLSLLAGLRSGTCSALPTFKLRLAVCKSMRWPLTSRPARRQLCGTATRPDKLKDARAELPNGRHLGTLDIAIAFDIDGVLYQGQRAIPGAKETLRALHSLGVRYVFLTNGGGVHEESKVKSLMRRLGLQDDEKHLIQDRIILSHTPMRAWPDHVKQKTALLTASHPDTAREIANEYGFTRVVTPADLLHSNDKIYPFDQLKNALHSRYRPLPSHQSSSTITEPFSRPVPSGSLKIDHILVWNDPRDWSLDIQVIYDFLVSHRGYLGTISEKNGDPSLPNNGWLQDGQPKLWISNLDLFWKTEYPVNRFGTGAFVAALKGVWSASTEGAKLEFHALGKPSHGTFDYAHRRLLCCNPDMTPDDQQERSLGRVYMIGDNPESDIRGANAFKPNDGTEWLSILVRTGVWRETTGEKEPRYPPTVIVDDVVDAVAWALRNEGHNVTRDLILDAVVSQPTVAT